MQLEQVRVCSEIAIECMDLDPEKRPDACHIINRLDKIEGADKSDQTGINNSFTELQVNLPREQFEERVGNPAAKSLQADVEEHTEILEDAAKTIAMPHFQEGQEKLGQLSLWGGQDMMEKLNRHETSNSSSTSTVFYGFSILNMYNKTAYKIFNRNNSRISEQSHFINIFRTEELRPIITSSNLIREVNSAKVYKGVVDDALVAVKQMFNADEKQLKNEVIIQSQIIHKNIACLIGCCFEMDNPILVYENLPRGTLHDILHSGSKVPLNLDVRLNIVAESAQGLAYLHSQARTKILHGDVKSANILFDHNFVPKVAVFDLSRLIARDTEHTSFVVGDMTYIDPVYMQTGLLTEKSDAYSLGVVILELISRKPTYIDGVWLVQSFVEFHREGKKATKLFDKEIAVTAGDLEILDCLAEIAVDCVNLDVDQRPTMTEVAERLLILNHSRRLHARHINADEETDISSSFVEQQKVGHLPREVQDMKRRGGGNSSSVSTGFFKLNNLDIFNWKARRNFNRNTRHTLEKSHFIKIFRREEIMPTLSSSNLIGKGSFSVAHMVIVDNTLVRVKKPLNGSDLENEQIENEVLIQCQVIHKNIVRLIGCCLERKPCLGVYEFLPGGSLDDILHGGSKVPLNLDVRLNIVVESAQGLAYMHSRTRIKILHGDVKPANILLDDNFIPKISDFGISRLMTEDKEHTGCVIGDLNYMDPLYLQAGLVSLKSDVYSFGVVILEVISRKKPSHSDNHSLVRSFLEAHKEGKKATELFDKDIAVTTGDLEILNCLAEIAVECISLDVDQRPTMTDVAERLLILNRSRLPQAV
uniref:Protein kinase domain-containing protein n=1 Tax=Hordeum vulgare subsp. vulgare TaxID=112509 RepID=A0A8I6YMT3_HORVV